MLSALPGNLRHLTKLSASPGSGRDQAASGDGDDAGERTFLDQPPGKGAGIAVQLIPGNRVVMKGHLRLRSKKPAPLGHFKVGPDQHHGAVFIWHAEGEDLTDK